MLFNKDKMDSVRVVLAVMAAVMSGGGALYGVYVKARSESRIDTAASYETLAPEINELKREVQELKNEALALRGEPKSGQSDQDEGPGRDDDEAVAVRRARPAPRRAPGAPGEVPSAERPAAPPETAPAPGPGGESPDIVEGIRGKIPIDFEQAEKIYKQIRGVKKP